MNNLANGDLFIIRDDVFWASCSDAGVINKLNLASRKSMKERMCLKFSNLDSCLEICPRVRFYPTSSEVDTQIKSIQSCLAVKMPQSMLLSISMHLRIINISIFHEIKCNPRAWPFSLVPFLFHQIPLSISMNEWRRGGLLPVSNKVFQIWMFVSP